MTAHMRGAVDDTEFKMRTAASDWIERLPPHHGPSISVTSITIGA